MTLTHEQARDLLRSTLDAAQHAGFEQCRVDTWRTPDRTIELRHHFSGGVFEITATHKDGSFAAGETRIVKWGTGHINPGADLEPEIILGRLLGPF